MMKDRSRLTTEKRNRRSADIDRLDSLGIVDMIATEDALVAPAVAAQRRQLAKAVDVIVERMGRGGRLIYVGAGTSGRLGVLDASECPPTFGTKPSIVQGVIAGGRRALVRSAEGAEDDPAAGAAELDNRRIRTTDVVCGIAACGMTPFVHGAVARAREVGAATLFVTCSPEVRDAIAADVVICPVVGPEVVTGSTRMKAGTATKLVLNTLTTAAMIRTGKVYGNLMVDLIASNDKLRDRAERILMELSGAGRQAAREILTAANNQLKPAIVMHARGVDYRAARKILAACKGSLRSAIQAEGLGG